MANAIEHEEDKVSRKATRNQTANAPPAIVSTVEARENFADLINRAFYGKEKIILERRGKMMAAIISPDDFDKLQRMRDRDSDQIKAAAHATGENSVKKLSGRGTKNPSEKGGG